MRGSAADFVVIHETGGRADAFVTCSIQHDLESFLGAPVGVIVLVGTAPEALGRGFARGLTEAALLELGRRGARWALVGTQIANISAVRLYESCGFRTLASSCTLRALL